RNKLTGVGRILPDRRSLIAAKEKQFVLNNGSAGGPTKLVALQGIVSCREIISRVEEIIPHEFEQITMELVGTGFRDGTDGSRFCILGRQTAGLDFEFLQCIGKRQWLTLAVVRIHVRNSIERISSAKTQRARHGDNVIPRETPIARRTLLNSGA